MSDIEEKDPWQQIRELQAEVSEVRSELRTCHDMLDGAGVAQEESTNRLTSDQPININLPARLMRYIMATQGCPMRRIR